MASESMKLHESIRDTIMKLLLARKVRKAIAAAKEIVKDDPTIVARLDSIKDNYELLEKELDVICQVNPDFYLCKTRHEPKAKWK